MRNFASRKARLFNIKGYVENLSDGRVHIHAEGTEKDLQSYLKTIKKGSPFVFFSGGRIKTVRTERAVPEKHLSFRKKLSRK